ncbi:MAG: hypothetical protein FJ299_00905 [Planctomycetes bacterium]|nr:hypothetical protein [Planctomycetota bacterium]
MNRRNWEAEQPDNPWRPRLGLGSALVFVGLVLIVAGTLYVATAGYGGKVRELEERRSYNQVKQSVQDAWFAGTCMAGSGLCFCVWGARLRKRKTA